MQTGRLLYRTLAGACLLAMLLGAQVAEKANRGYQTEEDRARMARNLASPDRVESQKPRELVAALGLREGEVVADVGAGVGFMLPYFVETVGPTGTVYAMDIEPDFLAKVEEQIAEHHWSNVKVVLGTQQDTRLPAGEIDLAFILDAYHHFNYPAESLKSIRAALKSGGRLVVVDFYRSREHPRMCGDFLKEHIRLDRDGFAAEIEEAGFRLERQFDHLPHQYVLIFRKRMG